jgi:predicted permease
MNAIGRSLEREYPDENRAAELRVEVASPVPGNAGVIAAFLALVMGIVLLVLVITCANVTSVLLARSVARRREIAVRIAMGAGRRRLVRQLLLETAALFSVGGVGGLLLARVLTSLLIARLPALPFPVEVQLVLDRRAIAFTMGLVLLATVLSGLVPASQASKTDVISTLRDDSGSPQRLRLRQVFVTTQVALAIVLVTVAGLFVRALQRAGASDPGFDPHGVELASLNLSQAGYSDAGGRQFARELLDRVRTLPEVQAASLALVLPGGFETQGRAVTVPGVTPPHGQRYFNVDWNVVEPGYFATLRLPLVAGRDFSVDDREGTEPVAIVGEGTAKRFWPGQVAIGKALVQHVIGPRGRTTSARTMRVIGIAHDARTSSLIDGLSRSLVYVPLQQQYTPFLTIVARTTSGQRMAEEVRKEVGALNPRLPIVSSQTMEEWLALGLVPQRVVASVAGSLGMVGLLIAAIGIYGVTAYVVTTRTREMGIRIALGATRLDVIGLIMRQGMSLTIVGTASGLMLSAVSSRLLRGFLFDVQPIDPLAFIAATTLFVVIGSAACYLPARRATSIEAVEALRHD